MVDDTPDLLRAICAMLEQQQGVQLVGTATDGAKALLTAQDLCPDLIVMDVTMPVMNGLEAAVRLREKFPKLKLVLMSADDDAELEDACHACGADAFVWKGHVAAELPHKISELFPQAKPSCTQYESLLAETEEADVYDFHNEHYEYYRELLEYAQSVGSATLAKSAAQMLLFHLRHMFGSLSRDKQQLLKEELVQRGI